MKNKYSVVSQFIKEFKESLSLKPEEVVSNKYGIDYCEHTQKEACKIKDIYDRYEESLWETDLTFGFNSEEFKEAFVDWFYQSGGEDAFWEYIEENQVKIKNPRFNIIE